MKVSDLLTEDTSIKEENTSTNKRKRVRKKKQKKSAEDGTEESDYSMTESVEKKPKVLDSVVISSGKHIRFKGIDEDEASGTSMDNNNIQRVNYNGDVKTKQFVNKDLTALLNLRQSSTPLTFSHKRNKRDFKPEVSNMTEYDAVSPEVTTTKTNGEYPSSSKINLDDDTYSFKVSVWKN